MSEAHMMIKIMQNEQLSINRVDDS